MAEDKVIHCFEVSDLNNDGSLDFKEFSNLLKVLDPDRWTDAKLELFFRAADVSGDGTADLQEILDWIFRSHTKSKSIPCDDSSDSSSSCPSDAEEQRVEQHRSRMAHISLKREVPETDLEQLYTLLTTVDGRSVGRLNLAQLLGVFATCKEAGLDPRLPGLVPQEGCEVLGGEPEDLCPLELGHLYAMLLENRQATAADALALVESVKGVVRTMDQSDLEAIGLEGEAVLGFGLFKQMVPLLSAMMQIDLRHMVASFFWARTNRFEMPEAMAIEVMDKLFLKVPKKDGGSVLQQSISCNDFSRLIFSLGLLDLSGKTGIPQGRVAILFGEVVKYMPETIAELKKLRAGETATSKLGKRSKARKHGHETIIGRNQIGILMEALFYALPPPRKYTNAMDMVLRFLEVARDSPLSPGLKKKTKAS